MARSIPIQGPLGLSDLLDRTFRLYRARFGRLVLTSAIILVPLGIATMLVSGVAMGSYMRFLELLLNGPTPGSTGGTLFGPIAIFLLSIVGTLGTMFVFTSLTSQVFAAIHGEDLELMAGLRRGARFFWSFLAMSILAGLGFGGIILGTGLIIGFVVFGVTAVLVGVSSAFGDSNVFFALIMLGTFGMVLFAYLLVLLPAILLAARWIVAPVLIVVEQAGPGTALGRSWRLTSGRLWRCFGYLILLMILNFVVLGLPMMVLQWAALILAAFQMIPWFSGAVTGVAYFLNVLWYPFLASALVLLYYDLRVRAESYDLDLRISQMEESVRPATLPGV